MKKYEKLLKNAVITIDKTLSELVEKNIEEDTNKFKFIHLTYLNLLANSVSYASLPENLPENFEKMKKSFELITNDYLRMVDESKQKDMH